MSHASHKARRIERSAVPHVRLRKHAPMRKDLMLGLMVGGSMMLITGLYAATFRYQKAFNHPADEFPRWSSLTDGIVDRTAPIQLQADKVKDAFVLLAKAKKTQLDAAAVLKKKLADRAATETPETH